MAPRHSTLRAGEWAVLAGAAVIAAFAALVGVLIYLKPPPVDFFYAESAATARGEALYRQQGCGSCHQVFGNGASYGPSLDGIGSRRSAVFLQAYLVDPHPGVSAKPYRLRMPAYGALAQNERDALVEYLLALRAADPGGPPAPPGGR